MSKATLRNDFAGIIADIPDFIEVLNYSDNKHSSRTIEHYLNYYNLNFNFNKKEHNNIYYNIGKFKAFDFDIVAQIFAPHNVEQNNKTKVKKLAVFIHGYLEHFALYRDLIQFLVKNNYIVIGIDLPGHGLSTGKIADIVDFSQYAHCIEVLVDILQDKFNNNIQKYLIGFSAGCAISTEYFLRNKDNAFFDKALWLAPLLKIPKWKYSELACYLWPFVKYVRRSSFNISHDTGFVNFIRFNDPLQTKMLTIRWVKALHHWYARLVKYKPIDNVPLAIIQGTKDTTVDWRFNILEYSTIFPNHEIHFIKDAYHHLCNELSIYEDRVFKFIKDFIDRE